VSRYQKGKANLDFTEARDFTTRGYRNNNNNNNDNNISAVCHLAGNSDADDPGAEALDEPRLGLQEVHLDGRIAVGDEHDHVRDVGAIAVGVGEYLGPRASQSAGRVGVAAAVLDVSDGAGQRPAVEKARQVELQVRLVTCRRDRIAQWRSWLVLE